MDKIKTDKAALKSFGSTMGVALLIFAGLFFFRHKYAPALNCLIVSGVFFAGRFAFPLWLKPVYILWMRLAFILGWVNTRIILVILFYLVFTPVGLIMRLFKADLLELREKRETYWKKKEKTEFNASSYERRF